MVSVGVARGPHWYLPGPEQLVRFCNIAQRLLGIIHVSHGLTNLHCPHVLNWALPIENTEKLEKAMGLTLLCEPIALIGVFPLYGLYSLYCSI